MWLVSGDLVLLAVAELFVPVLDNPDDRANAFMARPQSQEIGVKSGVIDGEVHYLDAVSTDE
jgi:hypothetical protein